MHCFIQFSFKIWSISMDALFIYVLECIHQKYLKLSAPLSVEMWFLGIEDVINFPSFISSIESQMRKVMQVKRSNNFKTNGLC